MIVKVPIYVEIEGPVHSPSLVTEALQLFLQNKLLSGRPEKSINLTFREKRAFKDVGIENTSFTLISREAVLDRFR